MLRIRERHRLGFPRDQAHQPLIGTHGGEMHRLAVQPLGGVKLKRVIRPRHINRADLRHHLAGDQNNDFVEPVLRAQIFAHQLAQTAKQHAWADECAAHA